MHKCSGIWLEGPFNEVRGFGQAFQVVVCSQNTIKRNTMRSLGMEINTNKDKRRLLKRNDQECKQFQTKWPEIKGNEVHMRRSTRKWRQFKTQQLEIIWNECKWGEMNRNERTWEERTEIHTYEHKKRREMNRPGMKRHDSNLPEVEIFFHSKLVLPRTC